MKITLVITSSVTCAVLDIISFSDSEIDICDTTNHCKRKKKSRQRDHHRRKSKRNHREIAPSFLHYHERHQRSKFHILMRVRRHDIITNLFSSIASSASADHTCSTFARQLQIQQLLTEASGTQPRQLWKTVVLPSCLVNPLLRMVVAYLINNPAPPCNSILVSSSLDCLLNLLLASIVARRDERVRRLELLLDIAAACYIAVINNDNFLAGFKKAALAFTETATTNTAVLGIESAVQVVGQAAAGVAVSAILDVAVTSATIYMAKRKRDGGLISELEFSTTVKKTVCESSCKFVCGATGSILGQVFIPVPVVGAFVGGLAGSLIGHGIGKGITYGVFDGFGRKPTQATLSKPAENNLNKYSHLQKTFRGHVPKITAFDEATKSFVDVYFERSSKSKEAKSIGGSIGKSVRGPATKSPSPSTEARPLVNRWRSIMRHMHEKAPFEGGTKAAPDQATCSKQANKSASFALFGKSKCNVTSLIARNDQKQPVDDSTAEAIEQEAYSAWKTPILRCLQDSVSTRARISLGGDSVKSAEALIPVMTPEGDQTTPQRKQSFEQSKIFVRNVRAGLKKFTKGEKNQEPVKLDANGSSSCNTWKRLPSLPAEPLLPISSPASSPNPAWKRLLQATKVRPKARDQCPSSSPS